MKTTLLAAVLALAFGCDAADMLAPEETGAFAKVPSGWSALTSMPTGVRAAAAAVDGRLIYVLGGNTGFASSTNLTQIYDISSDSWTVGAPFNGPRDFAMAAAMQDGIHLLGGAGGGFLNDHQLYDPRTDTWATLAPMPVAVDAAVTAVIGKKLYVIGGGAGYPNYKDAVQIYDPKSDSWSLGTPMPTPRLSAAAAVMGGMVYVAGGQSTGISTVATVERYDPGSDTWVTLSPMPVAREAHGGGLLGRDFCVFGGRLAVASPTGDALPETYCYDARKDEWTRGDDMLTPRAEMATADARGKLFSFGGRNQTAFANATVEILGR